jgi:mannose/fructose-specific phosphotransferase system component IIA
MSEELRGVVVCHGSLAGALVQAAEQISGLEGVLIPVSNTGCDRGTLEDRILAAVDGHPAVVFVDLASGSCLVAVLKRLRGEQLVKVVTGVNLAMLVDFLFHRSLSPPEAATRAAAAGEKSIRIP